MPIAARSSAGNAAFNEIRLRPRGVRQRIPVLTAETDIAFVAIVDKRDRNANLGGTHANVRNPIRRRTEVRMSSTCTTNETDVGIRLRIHGRRRNVLVPPVVRWKKLATAEVIRKNGRTAGVCRPRRGCCRYG